MCFKNATDGASRLLHAKLSERFANVSLCQGDEHRCHLTAPVKADGGTAKYVLFKASMSFSPSEFSLPVIFSGVSPSMILPFERGKMKYNTSRSILLATATMQSPCRFRFLQPSCPNFSCS